LFLKLTSAPCEAGQLEEALKQYQRAKEYGVERAAMHIRNVSSSNLDRSFQISYITTSTAGEREDSRQDHKNRGKHGQLSKKIRFMMPILARVLSHQKAWSPVT
jgi:1,2-phenylacetyl-CoA epoxidase PaaB subunit